MKAFLRQHTPKPIWNALKSGKLFAADLVAARTKRPPADLLKMVGGPDTDFDPFIRFCKNYANLTPHAKVLEVGCGVGRVAIPLTKYLSETGSYDGFDIVKRSIKWCRNVITPRHPNFRFEHADIYNTFYNPDGRIRGEDFRFP